MRRNLAILILLGLTTATCGCVAKFGAVAPTRGRIKPAFSNGIEIRAPLRIPRDSGELGAMLAFPWEEWRTGVDNAAGLSKGTLRVNAAGAQFRLMCGFPEIVETASFIWIGAGPEYHWNSFVVLQEDLSAAALNGVFYDEHIRDTWGGCFSFGIMASCMTAVQLELSYHWAHTSTEVKGTSGGMPFRWTRGDKMEWFSIFIGIGIVF